MFREFDGVRQEPGGRRRWFESDGLDLVVWFEPDGISGFQLLYVTVRGERALTWRRGVGFSHHAVDAGDRLLGKLSPVLTACYDPPDPGLAELFSDRAGSLEPEIADFVAARLRERTPAVQRSSRGLA
jgi:hypothetical protein